jgi:hypothetical protein
LGSEWRFLKANIRQWLATGSPSSPSEQVQFAVNGSWYNDLFLEDELKEISQRRDTRMDEDES